MEDRDGLGFGSGLLLGTAIGVIIGLLLAPQAGEATQEQLRERSRRWRDRAQGWADQARQSEAWQRGREVMADPDHPVGRAVTEGVEALRRTQRDIESKLTAMGIVTASGRPPEEAS